MESTSCTTAVDDIHWGTHLLHVPLPTMYNHLLFGQCECKRICITAVDDINNGTLMPSTTFSILCHT
eukprot:4922590-Ditylum_brightwellii.AAC.1